ncbi:MAG: SocA family protein [Prevotellaceae bacterium]|jgi:uncharacterized phage-associated protein|nr:SocA family protein [Prevotellaceae bacterium]
MTLHYSKDTIDKIGNAIVYFAQHINNLSKTKLLKLLYLAEEKSVKQFAMPFFGIKFDVWKLGPVAKDVFIELSDELVLLKEFINTSSNNGNTFIEAKTEFCDDEFSNNDIKIMNEVIAEYGNLNAAQIVDVTHDKTSAWYKTAKDNNLLKLFDNQLINNSDVEVDFLYYLDGSAKEHYLETMEVKQAFDALKRQYA